MKKQAYFSGPADYNTRRPYCVVTPCAPRGSYDIHSRWSSRRAALAACVRGTIWDSVQTITHVNKVNAMACDAEAARNLSYGND